MLGALSQVLAQLVAEGRLARNVAGLVDRVPGKARKFETFTADQVRTVLSGIAKDRNRHAWHLALAGLRAAKSLVCVGMTSISASGRCGSARLASTWRSRLRPRRPQDRLSRPGAAHPRRATERTPAAKARQAAERLALGEAYAGLGYVVCNEAGEPYHPSTLSTMWQAAIKNLDVPQVRLHDARHTCATLMHLQGVPIALGGGLAGPCRRLVHSSDVRPRPAGGTGTRGAQLCSADIERRRLTPSHTRAVTPLGFL